MNSVSGHDLAPRLDPDAVGARFLALQALLPQVEVGHLVTGTRDPALLRRLAELGAAFLASSAGEVDDCIGAGVVPEAILVDCPAESREALRHARNRGVRHFGFADDGSLDAILEDATGSDASVGPVAVCHVSTDGAARVGTSTGSACRGSEAAGLLRRAVAYGLAPAISIDVGSHGFDPAVWDRALAPVSDVRAELRAEGIEVELVHLVGGFPAPWVDPAELPGGISRAVGRAVATRLGPVPPGRIVVMPTGHHTGDLR